MLYIICPKNTEKRELPKDWKFMEKSGEVLKNKPETWKKYPDTESGAMSIVDMEYKELKDATTIDGMKCELVHLASACLYLWRKLNHVEHYFK